MIEINNACLVVAMICLCVVMFIENCSRVNEERESLGLAPQYNAETLNKCYKATFYTLIVVFVRLYSLTLLR